VEKFSGGEIMLENKSNFPLFKQILAQSPIDYSKHIIKSQLLEDQARLLNLAFYAVEDNIASDSVPTVVGGKVDKTNLEQLRRQLIEIIESRIKSTENQIFFKGLVPEYLLALEDQIRSTCSICLPVEDLPFHDLCFCSLPFIDFSPSSGNIFVVKKKGFSLAGIMGEKVPHDIALAVSYQNSLKIEGTDLFFTPLQSGLSFSRHDQGSIQTDLNFLHHFRQIAAKEPCFDEIAEYDLECQREGNPFAAFLNSDFFLFESLGSMGFRKVFDVEESPYSIAGIIQPQLQGSVVLLYNFQEFEFPNISATLKALCQLGGTTLEYPHLEKT
jgi:hypothetical protein